MEYQKTLNKSHTISGKGLHTGKFVTITLNPAPLNSGVAFCRTDIPGRPIIKAIATNVTQTERGTVLLSNGASVSTVEHLLSALYSMGVDNALIEADGPEIPILDGSAKFYADIIDKDGLCVQHDARDVFEVKEAIICKDPLSGSEIAIYPDNKFSVTIMVDFDSEVIGQQYALFDFDTNYLQEIAPCRTFVFLHDILPLIDKGLIKGGDLENAIVIAEKSVSIIDKEKLQKLVKKRDDVPIEKGYINTKLLYTNECARHKLLDLLGDLSLSGFYFKGRVIALKPGHKINTDISKILIEKWQQRV